MWMWLAAFTNIALYIPLYFCVRGNIDVHPVTKRITFNFSWWRNRGSWWKRRERGQGPCWEFRDNSVTGWRTCWASSADGGVPKTGGLRNVKDKNKEALKLVWYPISYAALVLPISIVRWSTFPHHSGDEIPVAELSVLRTALTVFVFGLSGKQSRLCDGYS